MTLSIEYGRDILAEAFDRDRRRLVVTAKPLVEIVKARGRIPSNEIHTVPVMEETVLAAWERDLPAADAVVGIGGGVCMDAAKYVAWRRGLPLVLAPSIVSVDACLTESIAVRRDGRVRYVGEVCPQRVLVDFALIQGAPVHLNRAGAGDILSIHTALWDWKLAAEKRGEPYDPSVAEQSAALLARLDEAAGEIRAVSETGIRTLIELYAAEVGLCRRVGNSRPEEGSEHFWAYNVEYRTRRDYVHGELVALGVLLMAALQNNELGRARALIERLGVQWRPEEVGLTREEAIDSLVTANEYAQAQRLAFSVLDARPLSREAADHLVAAACEGPAPR